MKFIAQPLMVGGPAPPVVDVGLVRDFARATEQHGFDAVSFGDHPAPPNTWMDGPSGHQAFDPFAALGYCAGITERIRLMTMLVVLPYRNPWLLAKSVATVDVLSGGRVTIAAGVGYIAEEFAALGADFESRNKLAADSLRLLHDAWASPDASTPAVGDTRPVSIPPPVQAPHPPLWVAGNGPWSRAQAAQLGQGWTLLQTDPERARARRTLVIDSAADIRRGVDDYHARLEAAGRDPAGADVALVAAPGSLAAGAGTVATSAHLDDLAGYEQAGVNWFVVLFPVDERETTLENVERYGTEVIAATRGHEPGGPT